MPTPISPKKIRFIKLGERGEWEESSIADGVLRLGYRSPHHNDCLRANWDAVRAYWLQHRNGDRGTATRDLTQIRDFYELSAQDVWITFHKKSMYWCRAHPEVIELEDGTRIRRTMDGWHGQDVTGLPLRLENLDGRVSKVRGYRGTICAVELADYLIRKINGEQQPDVVAARAALEELTGKVTELIRGLAWRDFELLVDLVFARAGWQRFAAIGATEKDTDLDLVAPLSGRRAFVQVKSQTTRAEAAEYIARCKGYGLYDEFYFVYHTATQELEELADEESDVHVIGLKPLADKVVQAGLVQWLIDKRS